MRKFMRTRGAAPPPLAAHPPHPHPHSHQHHKQNGHATSNGNGAAAAGGAGGARREDPPPSTLSSGYWRGSMVDGGGGVTGPGAGQGAGAAAGGALFCDDEFPAHWRSLGDTKYKDVVWLRPHELSGARAEFATALDDDEEPADHDRWAGGEGDSGGGALCVWGARCAAAALAGAAPRLLRHVLRAPQPLRPSASPAHHAPASRTRYSGRLTFLLWQFGTWRCVTVDDRLPTRRGRLLGARVPAAPHDYTLPLLEKAFAKLYGSYAAAAARCSVTHALAELTGGIVQRCAAPHDAAPLLRAALPRATLVVATPKGGEGGAWRALRSGLVAGQAYSVTGLARVRGAPPPSAAAALLVRVRACSGRGSRRSPPAALTHHDNDLLHDSSSKDDYWMPMAEFCSEFGALWLVHVGPDEWVREAALRGRGAWRAAAARRRWRTGVSAGGPPPAPEAAANPQFLVRVPGAPGGPAARTHVVVSVTQQYSPRDAARLPQVGFALYAEDGGGGGAGGGGALDAAHGAAAREAASFFTLRAGTYRVVPHARRPHRAAAFLLRVYTDSHTDIWEVNEDNVMIPTPAIEFLTEPQILTSEGRRLLVKLFGEKDFDEVLLEVEQVWAALQRSCGWWGARCGRRGARGAGGALCRTLCALAAPHHAARLPAARLPAVLHALHYWAQSFICACESSGGGGGGGGGAGAEWWAARGVLAACGARVSNKVLEALLARHVPAAGSAASTRPGAPPARALRLTLPHALHALATLALAHERYRQLDSKMKSNPLSLEETILMTICS